MKKFLPLLLCLLLSIFTMARATKPARTSVPDTRTAQNKPRGQQADAKTLLNDANTDEQVASDDDDSTEVPSNNEGQDINDDGGGDAPDDENTGGDDAGDDNGADDGGGDEGE
jgi:hypothetical protein